MQVVERQENSIVQTLSELREIERQRIADEIAALQREEAARLAAREAAERRAREEAEARARAEREAQLAAEKARLEAEREERRRIDAAAAAELARQQVALDQTRMERELELRREQVARTRPTWMVAVTALSLAAAGALLWLALSSRAVAEEANDRARLALLDRDQARNEAREAVEGLAAMKRELDQNARTIQSALEELRRAKTQADRDALDARLRREAENARQLEERRRADEEKRRQEARKRPIVIPEQCKQNSFAPGCNGN